MPTQSPYTYESNFPFNVAILKIISLDGLVGPVQLPGDTKISEENDQAGEDCAQYRQSHDESGVVQGLPIASPVYRAGKSEGLRPVASPAKQRKQGPQASIQPDPTYNSIDGLPPELDTCVQKDFKLSV